MDGEAMRRKMKAAAGWAKQSASDTRDKVSEVVRDARTEKVIETTCSRCGERQEVTVGGGLAGDLHAALAATGAIVGGTTGAFMGASVGLATGGAGMPATVPFGAGGAVAGAYVGDKVGGIAAHRLRSTHCTSCDQPLVASKPNLP
jgi:hypothetical protein